MTDALLKLGFTAVEETAIGATIIKTEYEKMIKEKAKDIIITSCCHSVNLLIQKYFPNQLPYLADVMSPMQAHCEDIRKRYPNAKTVFIGPCVAKKDEADYYKSCDAVLTFEQLTEWLKRKNITLEQKIKPKEKSKARFFPTTGGILKTMALDSKDYTYMAIDGVENCINALKDIAEGKLSNCFIEMSACVGSCIGGPVMEKYHHTPIRDYVSIATNAGNEDFDVDMPDSDEIRKNFESIQKKSAEPSETEIEAILKKMGKNKPEDELNCGSCGYDTCRKKAVAIYQGKADLSMCLPFLKDKAENFSDTIINNTPNGILVLNDQLEVQQINRSALKIMNINSSSDVLGEQVIRILDPKVFIDVLTTGKGVHEERVYLAEYNKYVEQTVIFVKDYNNILCLMRDVTDEQKEREKKESISMQTVEIADKVVDKQMRIVQEIASLLGETAAETKIALTKLKESISDE